MKPAGVGRPLLDDLRDWMFALAACLVVASSAGGTTRPQYGGVLRIELRATSVALRPAFWKAGSTDFATNERLAELMFDRLVSLDNYGRFQPQLATEWSHDATAKHWQFTLRPGVKFSDGTPLTPNDVVAALQSSLPSGMQMQMVASPAGVIIHSTNPANDMLELLSSGPFFVYKDDGDGVLRGTGPFVLESEAKTAGDKDRGKGDGTPAENQRLRFRFNENCWSGRPYLEAIEVTLNVPPLRALLDLQLGKTDLAELSVDTIRRAQQSNLRSWVSSPLTLYALRFSSASKTADESTLREAVGMSVDREAMARVLLQKQAEPANAFLPQWLSGYAFLFDTESNLERAKELRATLPANALGVTPALRVSVETSSDLSRLVAERIALNARAAGLTLQTMKAPMRPGNGSSGAKSDAEAQMVVWRYSSLSPRDELQQLAQAFYWQVREGGVPGDADARYAWEKRMMSEKLLLPIVAVPDCAGADARVRNWSPAPWGEWRLADVWLDRAESADRSRDAVKPANGAKP